MAAVGIVGGEGVGDFEADVEGGTVVDEFAALAISLHNGGEDTLEGKAIAGVGEHDKAFCAALRGSVAGKAIVEIRTYDNIGAMAARPGVERDDVAEFGREPPLNIREREAAGIVHRKMAGGG